MKPMKLIQKTPTHCGPLSRLGDSWLVSDELIDELDSFTCALYGQGRSKSVDLARHTKINALCGGHTIVPQEMWTWEQFLHAREVWCSMSNE